MMVEIKLFRDDGTLLTRHMSSVSAPFSGVVQEFEYPIFDSDNQYALVRWEFTTRWRENRE